MKDDCLPPTGVKPSARGEGDEAMDDGMRVKIEPCAKRVRVYLGGKVIVDSIRSKLVWEVPHYPAYYFPMAEVSTNSLLESDRTERSSTRGEARYFNVCGGNRLVRLLACQHNWSRRMDEIFKGKMDTEPALRVAEVSIIPPEH